MAPEIVEGLYTAEVNRQVYSNKADIWSIGVVLYEMFSCQCPFSDDGEILYHEVQFEQEPWEYASNESMDLIGSMLEKDPNVRCSINDVLNDPWFTNDPESVGLARQIMESCQGEKDSKQPSSAQIDEAKDETVPVINRKRMACWLCEESLIKESSFINHLRSDHGVIVIKLKRKKLSFEM